MNMKAKLTELVCGERGSAMIMTTLALVVLMAFAALAIDGGNLYFRHTRLQNIADCCALAACMKLTESNGSTSQAMVAASDCATQNGLAVNSSSGSSLDITYGDNESGIITMDLQYNSDSEDSLVLADIQVVTNLWFARVLGFNTTPVHVTATAATGSASEAIGTIPVGLLDKDANGNFINYKKGEDCYIWFEDNPGITLDPSEKVRGKAGFLDFPCYPNNTEEKDYFQENYGDNGSLLSLRMKYGYPGPVELGKKVPAEPGTVAAVKDYIEKDRIVIVPIINSDEFLAASGKKDVTVTGYAVLKIKDYVMETGNKHIEAVFDHYITNSSVSTTTSYYGLKAVRLVD